MSFSTTSVTLTSLHKCKCKLEMEKDNAVYKTDFRSEHSEVQILILHLSLFYWSLLLLKWLTSVSLFPGLQQTIQESSQRKSSFKILRCCFQTSLLWLYCLKFWQPVKIATFVFSWAKSTTLPKLQQESLHVERFLVLPEKLLHVERKLNQIRCLPTAQSYLLREQKDYNVPSILLGHHMGQQDFTFQRGQQREFGARTPLSECSRQPRTPSALKQSLGLRKSLLCFQWAKGSSSKPRRWWETATRGVHGKLSFYF